MSRRDAAFSCCIRNDAKPEGGNTMNKATLFRALMQQEQLIVAPGAYDGITARLIEAAGFPAVPFGA